jgi:hypothetical protein
MAEYSSAETRQKAAEASLQSYQSAADVAKGPLLALFLFFSHHFF